MNVIFNNTVVFIIENLAKSYLLSFTSSRYQYSFKELGPIHLLIQFQTRQGRQDVSLDLLYVDNFFHQQFEN